MKLVEIGSMTSVKKDRMRTQVEKCLLVLFSDKDIRFQTSKKDTVITDAKSDTSMKLVEIGSLISVKRQDENTSRQMPPGFILRLGY